MEEQILDVRRPEGARIIDPEFPDAPEDWTPNGARTAAESEKLHLSNDHWAVLRALQSYYAHHSETTPHLAELKLALEIMFQRQGGGIYLQELFPGGPVAQGCRLAGLKAPAGAIDKGFGSVV